MAIYDRFPHSARKLSRNAWKKMDLDGVGEVELVGGVEARRCLCLEGDLVLEVVGISC